MSADEAAGATPPATDEWVEVYRGPRRRGHIIIRVLTDASIPSRDARRLGLVAVKPQDGVVQVPKDRAAEATLKVYAEALGETKSQDAGDRRPEV